MPRLPKAVILLAAPQLFGLVSRETRSRRRVELRRVGALLPFLFWLGGFNPTEIDKTEKSWYPDSNLSNLEGRVFRNCGLPTKIAWPFEVTIGRHCSFGAPWHRSQRGVSAKPQTPCGAILVLGGRFPVKIKLRGKAASSHANPLEFWEACPPRAQIDPIGFVPRGFAVFFRGGELNFAEVVKAWVI